VININKKLKKRMAPYNVKILETDLEREYFTKHGLHLNSSGKKCIAQRLAMLVQSFLNKERMSAISLQWKCDTTFSDLDGNNNVSRVTSCNAMTVPQLQPSKSPKETLGKESQESAATTNKTHENEVKTAYPQLAKIQRKKPPPRNRIFYGQHKTCINSKPIC
jgi:hypothetical protein